MKKIIILLVVAFIITGVSIGLAADKKIDAMSSQKVIAECTKAIRDKPYDATAYIKRGKAYASNNQFELAMADYDVLQPQHAGAYLVKGVCYQQLARNEEAIATYRSLLANVPNKKETQEAIAAANKMLNRLSVED